MPDEPIMLWPKDIEFGDAILDDTSFIYMKLTDTESGQSVLALFGEEAMETILPRLSALAAQADAKRRH